MLLFLTFRLRFLKLCRTVNTSESYKNKHKTPTKKTYVVTDRSTTSTTTTKRPPCEGVFVNQVVSKAIETLLL
jgi:hypothetical protein